MDWEAEGLLEGLEDDDHRNGRAELLDYLHSEGCEVAELKQAVAEDRLVLLPVERLLAGDTTYSQRQIAEEAGLELDHLRRYRQALGLAVPDPDAEVLGEADLEGAKDTAAIAAAGFSTEDTLEVTRVLGRGMVRFAEALRTLFAQTFLEPGDTELALARRLQSQAEELLPLSSRLLDHVFLLHLQQLLRNDVLGIAERTSGKVSDRTDTAVAFADLVGFTELGETVDVEELGGLAGRLSRMASEVVEQPVRVVKQIGDAVMFVSPDAAAAVSTCLELIARAEAEELLPLSSRLLDHVFLLHLQQLLRNDVLGIAERTSGKVSDRTETAVAFADLVGFTELGETVDVEELGGLAGRLSKMASDVVEQPVRVVKQIGDAVMFVSPDAAAAVSTCLELIERAEAEENFPPLRAGVAFGPAINRWGDWFGSTVNVASRLTGRARPGAVLVSDVVKERVGDDTFTWSEAGEKKLKGLNKPLKTYRLRPKE